jgi:hypothetical protein
MSLEKFVFVENASYEEEEGKNYRTALHFRKIGTQREKQTLLPPQQMPISRIC